MTTLFEKGTLGDIEVNNRVFMAPLTRNRAHPDGTPHEMAIAYYTQRSSAGLIVTEATQISPMGKGYVNTPGIYNDKQVKEWKKITDSVHATGGKIVLQLWHVGRISHDSLLPGDEIPVAPSAIQADADTVAESGPVKTSKPRALELAEIEAIISDFAQAAKLSMEAGFDGVEVHGANGYLPNQFIATNTNTRDDQFGGSPKNRAKFLLAIVDAVTDAIGSGKVGVRLSPTGQFNDIHDAEISETYAHIYSELDKRNLAFLHVVEQFPGAELSDEDKTLLKSLKSNYSGNYIGNGGFEKESAIAALDAGAFAIAFGRPFISNPDLPKRLKQDAELAEINQDKIYGGDETGYSDYPALTI